MSRTLHAGREVVLLGTSKLIQRALELASVRLLRLCKSLHTFIEQKKKRGKYSDQILPFDEWGLYKSFNSVRRTTQQSHQSPPHERCERSQGTCFATLDNDERRGGRRRDGKERTCQCTRASHRQWHSSSSARWCQRARWWPDHLLHSRGAYPSGLMMGMTAWEQE